MPDKRLAWLNGNISQHATNQRRREQLDDKNSGRSMASRSSRARRTKMNQLRIGMLSVPRERRPAGAVGTGAVMTDSPQEPGR